ncbi:uncharacterized protein LOC107605708 [Arachis ipaensis]|uniref:uncharacterized protein LOC107605708 n=1 Tax=Arachis ipaensis TaxID=130454 RepID=UPI0007AF8D01|nr:uncharacterized protein LOC107605708 [Arachis ipaensis]
MFSRRFSLSFSFFFLFLFQITPFSYSSSSNPSSNLTLILQDVLKAISLKQKWDLNDLRVLNSESVGNRFRFGTFQNFEFRIGFGKKSNFSVKFSDQVASWSKLRRKPESVEEDLGSLIHRVSSTAVLDSIKLEGPFELVVDDTHRFSLSLPMNVSYTGLKHILVGEGITIEVKQAQEISLFYSSDLDLRINGTALYSKGRSTFWPFLQSMCMPLIPVRIFGSASLVAYKARNRYSPIETTSILEDSVELLPEKCYHGHTRRKRACPIDKLSSKLSVFEKILKSLVGHKILQDQFFGFVRANIKASAAVKFPLELERDIGSNVTLSRTLPDWRTRPSVERFWFEILAKLEADRLKPVLIKKVKPFIESDSASWANLMSNMSYTKLRPVLLPPEALTLDVKW